MARALSTRHGFKIITPSGRVLLEVGCACTAKDEDRRQWGAVRITTGTRIVDVDTSVRKTVVTERPRFRITPTRAKARKNGK